MRGFLKKTIDKQTKPRYHLNRFQLESKKMMPGGKDMKTEKISVNLSPVELGQIDFLVENGLYDSRSDFMRTVARKELEKHSKEMDSFINVANNDQDKEIPATTDKLYNFGVANIGKNYFEKCKSLNRTVDIRCIGMLTIANSVTEEEIRQTVSSFKMYGKLVASDQVKQALKEIEEASQN